MDAELAALAAGGASTIVNAMVTDAWGQAKEIALEFWRRHWGSQAPDAERELDAARIELIGAGAAERDLLRARCEGRWQGRLEGLLEASQSAALELGEVTRRIEEAVSHSASTSVTQHVHAGRDAYTVARGDMVINVREQATQDREPGGLG